MATWGGAAAAANEYPLLRPPSLARDVRTTHQGIPNSIMEIDPSSARTEFGVGLCGTDNDPSMMGIDFEMRRLRPSFERKKMKRAFCSVFCYWPTSRV